MTIDDLITTLQNFKSIMTPEEQEKPIAVQSPMGLITEPNFIVKKHFPNLPITVLQFMATKET